MENCLIKISIKSGSTNRFDDKMWLVLHILSGIASERRGHGF